MKKILLFTVIFIIFSYSLCFGVSLNQYGHILVGYNSSETIEYFYNEDEYLIKSNNNILKGNAFYEIQNGFLTLTTIEENVPTALRIYQRNGSLCFEREFKKIINIRFSSNKSFASFFDGEYIVVLNLTTFDMKHYPGSSNFSVDDNGFLAYYNVNTGTINYNNYSVKIEDFPAEILIINDNPLIFKKNSIEILTKGRLKKIVDFEGIFFEAKFIKDTLYFVEKKIFNNQFRFTLYKTNDFNNFIEVCCKEFTLNSIKTHEQIISPLNYGTTDYPFPIGNSYAEIQQYGSTPYLHPGVDFLGDDYQNVYAVQSGVIKAILTTGGNAYWRIAIAISNTPFETEGYLYAHLNQYSIPFSVGETVNAGDFLGTLYPWGWYDFTHIHFARIISSGYVWNGNWWTTDNPHIDITNIQDTIPPTFENAFANDLFAFRTDDGIYLDPMDLIGEVDIIAKCYDIANSDWKIDVWELSYKLHPFENPDSTIFEKFAFAYDMPLDTYINGTYDWMVLQTIYSRDATCFSIGNYEEREYYHIITNSDGDSVITEDDAEQIFNTEDFPDGDYIFEVIAKDASMNQSSAFMIINFCNYTDIDGPHEYISSKDILLQNYPNPVSTSTTISFNLSTNNQKQTRINIYNIKGELVKHFEISNPQSKINKINWDGTVEDGNKVSPGVYFYKLGYGDKSVTKRMILVK